MLRGGRYPRLSEFEAELHPGCLSREHERTDHAERNVYITPQNDDMNDSMHEGSPHPGSESVSVSVRFAVAGNMCHVSHAEMLRLFQRAFARAGIPLSHSHGFNPRPKLSLPLPRSVGVESDDELLRIKIDLANVSRDRPYCSRSELNAQMLMNDLGEHLPPGCELISAALAESSAPPQPRSAVYVLAVKPQLVGSNLEARIQSVCESESLPLERRAKGRGGRIKTVDVREFLKSLELRGQEVVVECKICSGRSIRVEEILNLLNLDPASLAAPVRRKSVQWLKN
jgi:radical SAM-linked protein